MRATISALEKSAPPECFLSLNHTIQLVIGHGRAVWLTIPQKQQLNLIQPEYYLMTVEEMQQMCKAWFHVFKLQVQQKEEAMHKNRNVPSAN